MITRKEFLETMARLSVKIVELEERIEELEDELNDRETKGHSQEETPRPGLVLERGKAHEVDE